MDRKIRFGMIVAAGVIAVGYAGTAKYRKQSVAEEARIDAECADAEEHLAARAAGHPLPSDFQGNGTAMYAAGGMGFILFPGQRARA
jgi:hypothetical protein